MSDAIRGLTADRSERVPTSFEGKPTLGDDLRRAAHETARLGSGAYDRVARFTGEGARVVHLGARSTLDHASGLARDARQDAVRAVTGAADATVRRFDRAAEASGRVGERVMAAVAAAAAGARVVPDAYRSLMRHMTALRAAAADGLKDGLLQTGRFFGRGVRNTSDAIGRSRERLQDLAASQFAAVEAFARAARESRHATTGASVPGRVAEEAGRLRRWAASMATGALMGIRFAAADTLDKANKAGRFFREGSIAVQVGATETLRSAASSRHVRTAGFVAGAAGLAALGFGAGSHSADIARGLADVHAHLPDPATVMASVGRAARHATDYGIRAQIASAEAMRALAERAARAGSTYLSQVAGSLGRSGVGQEVVRVAGTPHASGGADAYAQIFRPATHAVSHAQPHADTIRHVVAHAHHGAAHHHAHLEAHHGVAGGFTGLQPGDRTADALNDGELLRIKLDALRAGHHVAAAVPAHAMTSLHDAASDVVGTAPVAPVTAQALPPPGHAVAARNSGSGGLFPTMPHIDLAAVEHELGLDHVAAAFR